MPVYAVTNVETGKVRIVVADIVQQAYRHVSKNAFTAVTLTTEKMAKLIAETGAMIEFASEPEPPAPEVPLKSEAQVDFADETYNHKPACPADSSTPIGKGNCICMQIDL